MTAKKTLGAKSLICHNCIGDSELRRRIKIAGTIQICAHCGKRARTLPLEKIAGIVDGAFRNFYEPGDEIPEMDGEHDGIRWGQEGDPPDQIITELIDSEPEIGEAIVDYLSSAESYDVIKDGATSYYDSGSNYVEANLNTHEHFHVWTEFRERIKHKTRFFDQRNSELLEEIFKDIKDFSFGGAPAPVRKIDPRNGNFEIYRARRASSGKEASRFLENPDLELGPPPARSAKAGRMNPAGISVFYGATYPATCIAELRPTVGSLVVYAAFTFTRTVTLLDLSVFEKPANYPSVFKDAAYGPMKRWKFLHSFHRQIIRPIQPEDEPIEYVPTQAVAEYVANELKYDGIIYSSAQVGKSRQNIALFNVSVAPGNDIKKRKPSMGDVEDHEREKSRRPLLRYVPDSAKATRISRAEYKRHSIQEEDLVRY